MGHAVIRVFTSGVRVLAPHGASRRPNAKCMPRTRTMSQRRISTRATPRRRRNSSGDLASSLPFWLERLSIWLGPSSLSPSSCLYHLTSLFSNMAMATPAVKTVVTVLLTILLLCTSNFISTSRVTFFSLSPISLDRVRRKGRASSEHVDTLLGSSRHLLTAVLVSGGFIGMAVVVLYGCFFTDAVRFKGSIVLRFLLVAIILAFLLLLFNRVVPGVCSTRGALGFYHGTTPIVSFLGGFFSPLSTLLIHSSFLIGEYITGEGCGVSISRLSRTLRLASGDRVSRRDGVLRNVVHFNRRATGRIVASQLSVISLRVGAPCSSILGYVIRGTCSHVPMCTRSQSGVGKVLCVGSLLPRLNGNSGFH